jgi:N-acetylglutamate synthase-like GNAT family acetyltransferase
MADPADKKSGYKIAPISVEAFRDFAKRYARSDEVGPIATALDKDDQARDAESGALDMRLYGLYGCDRLCAIACLQPVAVRTGTDHAVKLDSVAVHGRMRQRGLGGLIVTHAFADVTADPSLDVSRFYSHAVHPATVKLLARLGFGAPPPTGAPLSALDLGKTGKDAFVDQCRRTVAQHENYMKVQCTLCRSGNRRARQWCLPDKDGK